MKKPKNARNPSIVSSVYEGKPYETAQSTTQENEISLWKQPGKPDFLWTLPMEIPAEKANMEDFQSFAEVLEQKIRQQIKQESAKNHQETHAAQSLSDSDYAHLSWLLGQTPVAKVARTTQSTPYDRFRPAPRPAHRLSEEQKSAFVLLKGFFSELNENFSARDLKKAYRSAAQKTHPDHGGYDELFIQVRSAFQVLHRVFVSTHQAK